MTTMAGPKIHLEPVSDDEAVVRFLYDLLALREDHENISHRQMPSYEEHRRFVAGRGHHYRCWFLMQLPLMRKAIGAIYLTHRNEIGVHLLADWRRKGLGETAVKMLLAEFGPGTFFANIAPSNYRSQEFFEAQGFRIIQYTYRYEQHTDETSDAAR